MHAPPPLPFCCPPSPLRVTTPETKIILASCIACCLVDNGWMYTESPIVCHEIGSKTAYIGYNVFSFRQLVQISMFLFSPNQMSASTKHINNSIDAVQMQLQVDLFTRGSRLKIAFKWLFFHWISRTIHFSITTF